jgi:hypothetical protein
MEKILKDFELLIIINVKRIIIKSCLSHFQIDLCKNRKEL